jgi:putative colanic acid biosynthesis UDP-glucose lipid carrier transferase
MTISEDGKYVEKGKGSTPRVTKLGSFLRRTSLDELPQFFNVLQGSMSIVGPRPHTVAHNEFYRGKIKDYMLRHKVKPGITGLAQVRGFRGETENLEQMENRVRADLEYIDNWSLWLDVQIIFLTVLKGLIGL